MIANLFTDGIVNSHKQSKSPYGKLSYSYGGLIISKLLFHAKYPNIPGTLNIKDQSIIKNDPANNFELAIEFLDLLERIIKVKRIILGTFDPGKAHSSTASGQVLCTRCTESWTLVSNISYFSVVCPPWCHASTTLPGSLTCYPRPSRCFITTCPGIPWWDTGSGLRRFT